MTDFAAYEPPLGITDFSIWVAGSAWGFTTDEQGPVISGPPTITVQPHPNDPYITVDQPFVFTIEDDVGLNRVSILVEFSALGEYEVAYDGTNFAPRYSTSTFVPTDPLAPELGGVFTIKRDEGWPSGPTIRAFAFDADAQELA